MRFDSEKQLKEVTIDALKDGFTDDSAILLDEFEYANGRADIVIANTSEAYLKRRTDELGIVSPITNKTHLQVFLQLHGRGPITEDHFYTVGAFDKRTKQKALESLSKKGFVKRENDKIRTARNLRRHVTTSYSIELKLGKWRKAMEQAVRGKSFADYQFVAMPEDQILRALENEEMFEERGVGIIEIKDEGGFYIHHHPDKESPYSPMNKWRLNERTINLEVQSTIQSSLHVPGD